MLTLAAVAAALASAAASHTLYVAPGGSDAADCRTPATACASFDRAYHAAAPGDVVEVAAGTYPPQQFSVDPRKTSPADVVVRPVAGSRVVVGCPGDGSNCISTEGADHLTVRGFRTADLVPQAGMPRQGGVALDRGSEDVTFADVDAGHIFIASRDSRVIGGDYGPTVDEVSKIANDVGPDIVIDGARFHHHRRDARHMECIALYGARGVVIRRSRFDTCAVFAIFSAPQVGEQWRDVRIENNVFSNSGGVGMSAHVKLSSHGGDCSNVLVRNNTFVHENVISDCGIVGGSATGVRWIGNIFESHLGCPGGGHVFDYNVIERGDRCGPHDLLVGHGRAGFVDRAGLDLRLRAGSPAIDRGSPADFPADDIDGNPRPFGAAPDAGADEYGSAGGVGPGTAPGGPAGLALTVDAGRRVRLARLLRRGFITFRAGCSRRCTLRAELVAGPRLARRVGLGRGARLIARARPRVRPAGMGPVTVRLTPRAARALRRAQRRRAVHRHGTAIRLTLRTTASDGGQASTVVRRPRLVR